MYRLKSNHPDYQQINYYQTLLCIVINGPGEYTTLGQEWLTLPQEIKDAMRRQVEVHLTASLKGTLLELAENMLPFEVQEDDNTPT